MTTNDDDIFEQIHDHIKYIKHSCMFYRPIAKLHKMNALDAATQYLAAEMPEKEFLSVLRKNNHYADALGSSKTKKLIEAVLKETPSSGRTKEGYIRFKPDPK